MRTSQAARYARWAAATAFLVAAIAGGVFAYRSWEARQARKHAPPVVPPTVQHRSAGFSFSKVEQERTLFTVRASRATEFKEGKKNLLEDVWITIYGRGGQRFDNIHTQACDYLADSGRITCAGEVQMDLESAEEARARPGQRAIHVGTRNLSFERESGVAHTDQPVVFRFPDGQGRGVGLTYSSREAVVRLHRDAELTLTQRAARGSSTGTKAAEPVTLTGGSIEYRREDHTLRLLAPVRARQGLHELTAGELALELDAELHARRLVARRQPELHSEGPRGRSTLAAEEFVGVFHGEGWMERIVASGNVRGILSGAGGEEHLEAERLELEMLPRRNQPNLLTASGDVKLDSRSRGEQRRLATSAVRLFFVLAANAGERRLDRAETLAPAVLEWEGTSSAGGKALSVSTRLRGEHVAVEFGERNELRQLNARGGVEIERRLPDHPPQVTTSRELVAKFGPGSEWAEVEQSGNVHLREADRRAQADRARRARANDIVTLTGSVVLADPLSRTTAQGVSFDQRTGEIRAEGDVRTSYLSAGSNAVANLAPEPAHISSDRLLANASGGRAVYSGGARLWQGDSVVEADSLELLRDAPELHARGNVRAVFPQVAASPGRPAAPGRADAGEPGVWRVRAGTLTYWSAEARALLVENVTAESRQGLISGRTLEIFLASAGGSPQQVTRAAAAGGVAVRQGERRGTAERAEYTAAEGKFVLSGGQPTLYDAFRGTTTGRQLTFFFADDRIVVDSEEGSHTLTRHRVEK